jgi:hypothetical protein
MASSPVPKFAARRSAAAAGSHFLVSQARRESQGQPRSDLSIQPKLSGCRNGEGCRRGRPRYAFTQFPISRLADDRFAFFELLELPINVVRVESEINSADLLRFLGLCQPDR